jgi:hypothetical protein
MPTFSLTVKYKKNRNTTLSVSELKTRYFFGIPIVTPDGQLMSDQDIEFYINSAISELNTKLDLIIPLTVVDQNVKFLQENNREWGFVKTNYPVVCVKSLDGFIGKVRQVKYPKEWFSIQKSTDGIRHRRISIVPNQGVGGSVDQNAVFAGSFANLGYFGQRNIPDYWNTVYLTGFEEIPADIQRVIGMLSSIPIYAALGNLVLGAGIASQSIGLDGLSMSIGTTASAENSAYSATISDFTKQIKSLMPSLINKYKGIVWGAM